VPLYELEEGTSRKFYRIELHGTRVHLNWGRIGAEGEHQILSLGNEAQARAEYQRQLNQRLERGYRLVVDEGAPHDPEALEKARLEKTGALSASPRFLFVHRGRRRFAWVEARGAELVHVEGAAAETASTEPTVKLYSSADNALRARDDLIARWMARGYELDTFGKKERPKKPVRKSLVQNEALERAVAEDPYDDDAWAVLEDWILQHDDARADLVRAAKAKLAHEQTEAHNALLPILLGPRREPVLRAIAAHSWRAGYIVECTYREPHKSGELTSSAFYQAPATRLLRALTLDGPLAAHLRYIAQAPCHRSLRRLIAEGSRTNVADAIDAGLLPPQLVLLRATCGYARLAGEAALPRLEKLSIVTSMPEVLADWVGQRFPALQELDILLDGTSTFATAVNQLAPLFERQMAPRLESLMIYSGRVAQAITEAVEASPLRAQLRVLVIEPS
jgi:uncharacterized protein (TIGR02996 family)